MNNKINNQKTSVPKGIELNDKDYLNKVLCSLKEMEKNLCVALTEASNDKLFKEYLLIFDNISKYQRKAYELMFKNGWYTLEKANKTKINELTKNLTNDLNSLN